MNVEVVPVEYVHRVWPDVKPLIEAAYEHGHGEYTIEQTLALLASGEWRLLAVTEGNKLFGAIVVSMFNRPNHRVAFVQVVGGRKTVNQEVFDQTIAIVTQWGATSFEAAARPSMQRLLERVGMTEKYRIMGFAL